MSTPDERLSDLLAERARQGSGVHPTREGVSVALTRRATRRRRRRTVVTGLAGLCLVAGVVGGLVLAGDDGDQDDGFTSPTGSLPDVPVVGLDIDGFVPGEPQTGDLHLDDEPARTVVVFRSGRSLADPFVTVAVQPPSGGVPPEVRGDPIDLDGDGVDDAGGGGNDAGLGIEWRLNDGSVATVGADLVGAESEDALITYAREVFSPTLDLDDLPAPDGLPERETWTLPDPRGPAEASVTYEASDGSERWITVSTTNQPGYFDLLQDSSANPADGFGFEEIDLGASFLGSGQAIVFDEYSGPGRDYALIRTDTGLTLEITTGCRSGLVCSQRALDAGSIRDVIRTGAFVEVEPTDGPPTTTVLAPTTTVPPVTSTSTSVVPAPQALPSVTRSVDELGEHLTIEFDGVPPALGAMTLLETLTGDCARFEDDFERIVQENGDDPNWRGWLTVELEASLIGIAGPVFGGPALGGAEDPGYILCQDGADPATIAIPVAHLGEPTVTPLSGRPAVLIDIPRS